MEQAAIANKQGSGFAMKSFIALTVGLVGIGSESAFSDLAFGAPATFQSYLFSLPEPGLVEMLLAGAALMLFVAFRKKPRID
jgi:hypothetical protein